MSIVEFINHLKNYNIPHIRNVNGLIDALHELDSLIGMKKAKSAIIDQLKFLLTQDSFDGHMLHCLITGPPGVGKTQLGITLSKIWNHIGILDRRLISKSDDESDEDVEEKNDKLYDTLNNIAIHMSEHRNKIRKIREQVRLIGNKQKAYNIRRELALPLSEIHRNTIAIMSKWSSYIKAENKDKMDETIRITSRDDFVARYVGQTGPKTLKVLKSSLGKVLFVDEAYSLYNGGGDSFGKDALNTINRYMSEHPTDIIVVFAGYKDQLQSVLDIQPGLKRRFVWTFDVEGYNAEELSCIFKRQVEKDEWSLSAELIENECSLLKTYFTKHMDKFKSYGGDTERLLFYSKLAYGNQRFDNFSLKHKTITMSMIEEGIKRFDDNSGEKKGPILSMYL